MMAVMAIVFSAFFVTEIDNYPLYLIVGNTLFGFFQTATTLGVNAIIWNSDLIRKVYIPKVIFPISVCLSSLVNFLFSSISLLIVVLFTGASIKWAILLLPIPVFFTFLFALGVALILSALNVFFRDIEHLYTAIVLTWMYITPVFYTVDIVPVWAKPIVWANPMTQYLTFFRVLIINGTLPDAKLVLWCIISSLVTLVAGLAIFFKLQKKFILRL